MSDVAMKAASPVGINVDSVDSVDSGDMDTAVEVIDENNHGVVADSNENGEG